MRSRVVVTGLGPISANAQGIAQLWDALLTRRSALTPIEAFDASGFRPGLAGEVRDINIRDFVPKSYRKATKVMARDTELAVIAAKLAADDAMLTTRGSQEPDAPVPGSDRPRFAINPSRTGCQIGAGLIAADTEELARAVVSAEDESGVFSMRKWGTLGGGDSAMNNLPPLWLLKYLPNMLACHVTIIHGLEGPSNTIMGAEAGAILSIGESARVIERGSADICFTGGAESRINPLGLLRWDYSGRLADTRGSTDPHEITRPFDPGSKGGILGEAGGMIVLEDEQHAASRKARIYAVVAGFGAAQSPPPNFPGVFEEPQREPIDLGLVAAIESALADAQIGPRDIDLIVPLGLGVPALDAMEHGALRSIFAGRLAEIPVLPLADLLGNTLAAHGGLMTAAAAMCLFKQVVPPSIRLGESPNHPSGHPSDHPAERVDTQSRPIRCALVATGSLGGQTGALVLKKYEPISE